MNGKYGCALLAGGRGKRMDHQNKAELKIGGRSFAEVITGTLRDAGFAVYISSSAYPLNIPEWAVEVPDVQKGPDGMGIGPVGGIFSCLLKAGQDGLDGLFFVPCDAPLIHADVFLKLGEKIEDSGVPVNAALWQTRDGKLQPVFGFYSIQCLPVFESFIREGNYRLTECVKALSPLIIPAESGGLPDRYFTNVNTAEDYRMLTEG